MEEKKENQDNTQDEVFFNSNHVKNRYDRIVAMMLDREVKNIQELADKCGVSRSLMSQVLHEHIEPTDSLKLKMAEVLNTDTLVLFGGK